MRKSFSSGGLSKEIFVLLVVFLALEIGKPIWVAGL